MWYNIDVCPYCVVPSVAHIPYICNKRDKFLTKETVVLDIVKEHYKIIKLYQLG